MLLLKSLYDRDFNLWIEAHTQLLKEGRLQELDIANLIEELESMGKSEKEAIESCLIRTLQHLLKWKYQPEKRSRSWEVSITKHTFKILRLIKKSPSLKRYLLEDVFDECYQQARKLAAKETGLELGIFPVSCPFSEEDVLNPDYLP